VIEGRSRPRRRVMALLTGLREARRHVVRIRRGVEIVQVAADAGRVGSGQVVIVVDVAQGARNRRVRTGQWEAGRRVVKRRARPGGGVVTLFAGLRDARRDVIRIRGSLEILQVATYAGGRRQVVVVVDVALRALQRRVRAGQREACVVVIKGGLRPRRRVVALLTGLREPRTHVIRIRRTLEIFHVAADAIRIRACQVVVVVDVALGALQSGMRAGQRESGRGVIESRSRPRRGVMALRTSLREAGLYVIRIGSALEILQVAADASRIRTREVVVVVDVALRALHGRMRARQREAGRGVVEIRVRPRGRVVTLLTGLREPGLYVVRTGRSLEILQVAVDARRLRVRHVVVVVDVALRARHRRVRAGQRETSRGVIERRGRPRRRVVALLTGLCEARLHVIRIRRSLEILQVATDAGRVRGGQVVIAVHVALRALHRRVRTAQREAGRRMIKRRIVPRRRVVALLARGRESRRHVVRIGRAIEILHVARTAIRRRSHKLIIDMACRTGHADVRSGQRELGECIVIESRRIPRAGVMACLARRREPGLGVRGIVRLVEVRHVAAHAGCRGIVEFPTRVAGGAIQRRVCTR